MGFKLDSYGELFRNGLRTLKRLAFKGKHRLWLIKSTKSGAISGKSLVIKANKVVGNGVDIDSRHLLAVCSSRDDSSRADRGFGLR